MHVGRTFAVSYERLDASDPTDELARALLARAACFAPGEPIPRSLLQKTMGPLTLSGGFIARWRRALRHVRLSQLANRADDALARLSDLGLLETMESGALRLHRLVAAFVRVATTDDDAQQAVEASISAEAGRANRAGDPRAIADWLIHLRFVTDRAQSRGDKQGALLCNTLGYHLQQAGDLAGARPYFERALAIYQELLGESHPDTATSLNSMGYLLQTMGDLTAARPYFERALAICLEVLGEKHPDTATQLNNMGFLLQAAGDLAGVRPYYERALAIYQAVLGESHPDTARSLNNMGGLLKAMGDLAGARPYYERALAILHDRLGPDHPDTQLVRDNLESLRDAPQSGAKQS